MWLFVSECFCILFESELSKRSELEVNIEFSLKVLESSYHHYKLNLLLYQVAMLARDIRFIRAREPEDGIQYWLGPVLSFYNGSVLYCSPRSSCFLFLILSTSFRCVVLWNLVMSGAMYTFFYTVQRMGSR